MTSNMCNPGDRVPVRRMSGGTPGQASFQHLFKYWNDVRGAALVPLAGEVDPAGIPSLLKEIAIFDLKSPIEILYRLAGTAIGERTGIDPTGRNLLNIVGEESRTFVSAQLFDVISRPAGLFVEYENLLANGKRTQMESLYLPMRTDMQQASRIISIHAAVKTLSYETERALPEFAIDFTALTWIDIGAGTPDAN